MCARGKMKKSETGWVSEWVTPNFYYYEKELAGDWFLYQSKNSKNIINASELLAPPIYIYMSKKFFMLGLFFNSGNATLVGNHFRNGSLRFRCFLVRRYPIWRHFVWATVFSMAWRLRVFRILRGLRSRWVTFATTFG